MHLLGKVSANVGTGRSAIDFVEDLSCVCVCVCVSAG